MKNKIIYFLTGLFISVGAFSCGKPDVHSQQSNTTNKEADACCHKPDNAKMNSNMNVNTNNNSIYQLNDEWINQDNEKIKLNRLKGKIQLVAMVFTHCGYACPKMVGNIRSIEKQLPDNLKNKVGYVLVSFDTERDTPERLHEYAAKEKLDNNWTLLHGTSGQVRILSMLLQTQYSQLPNGDFNHSNVLTVLNDKGDIIKQFEGLDIVTADVVNEITQLAKQM